MNAKKWINLMLSFQSGSNFEIVLKATEQPKILKFTPIKKINLDLAKSDLEARNFQIRMLYSDRTGYINQSISDI